MNVVAKEWDHVEYSSNPNLKFFSQAEGAEI